jgi:hypothetical protein
VGGTRTRTSTTTSTTPTTTTTVTEGGPVLHLRVPYLPQAGLYHFTGCGRETFDMFDAAAHANAHGHGYDGVEGEAEAETDCVLCRSGHDEGDTVLCDDCGRPFHKK